MEFIESLAKILSVSPSVLLAGLFVAIVLFLLAFREFLSWYLRIHSLQNDINLLRQELLALKGDLKKRPLSNNEVPNYPVASPTKQDSQEKREDRFILDH